MIKVSETAKQRVVFLMTEEGYDAQKDYVRVGVKSGGCSGQFHTDYCGQKEFSLSGGNNLGIFGRAQWQGICVQQPQCAKNLWMWGEFFSLMKKDKKI